MSKKKKKKMGDVDGVRRAGGAASVPARDSASILGRASASSPARPKYPLFSAPKTLHMQIWTIAKIGIYVGVKALV